MPKPIYARDIMVTKLVTLTPDMELLDAAVLLLKHKISGAPVVDADGTLIGIFSEKDVMNALIDTAYDEIPSADVSSYMSRDVHTISEDADILMIAQTFKMKKYRRLPVVRERQLVGQVSRRDVMAAVVKLLDPADDRKAALLYLSALRNANETPLE